jgi:hypothetical protein
MRPRGMCDKLVWTSRVPAASTRVGREPLHAQVGGASFSASFSPSCKRCLRLLDTGLVEGQLDGERQPDLVAISGGSGDETFSFDAREIRNFFAPTHLARSPASRRLRELHRLFALKASCCTGKRTNFHSANAPTGILDQGHTSAGRRLADHPAPPRAL